MAQKKKIWEAVIHGMFLVLGLIGTVTSFLGHFLGAGLAIKNGSKIVKPAVILVLVLLAAKVIQGLIAG
mgnify:CR=1 FL=1